MKLSEIAAILREIGVSPVKSLGQNFLHDRNLAKWLVDQAAISPEDFIVEIGPGLGALTELALAKGARVSAIEKDKRLVQFLREKFQGDALEVVHGDALEFDTRMLYAQPKVKLLGNLPYYISSQLLIKFLNIQALSICGCLCYKKSWRDDSLPLPLPAITAHSRCSFSCIIALNICELFRRVCFFRSRKWTRRWCASRRVIRRSFQPVTTKYSKNWCDAVSRSDANKSENLSAMQCRNGKSQPLNSDST